MGSVYVFFAVYIRHASTSVSRICSVFPSEHLRVKSFTTLLHVPLDSDGILLLQNNSVARFNSVEKI